MERARRLSPGAWVGAVILVGIGGCSRGETAAAPQQAPPVQIGRESVTTAKIESIATGPMISGQLSAETQATVRAKIGGSIVAMQAEQGQAVAKGAVLARIEARDLGEAVASANAAVSAAEQALKLAQTEAQRAERLVAGGALAQRDLDNARNSVVTAESQLAAARARGTTARAQLGDTIVRSPIRGVVSRKPANTGDVVAAGAELYTVIDPTSMRLEAAVPSDQIQNLRTGLPVVFTVKGYDDPYKGTITRINPAADPATRQVPILVSIPNTTGRLIAGLYAEGRVETAAKKALVVPGNAIDTAGGAPGVTRVKDGKAERVTVSLGVRDTGSERVEVVSGLSEGDTILIGAARGVTPGTPVTITGSANGAAEAR